MSGQFVRGIKVLLKTTNPCYQNLSTETMGGSNHIGSIDKNYFFFPVSLFTDRFTLAVGLCWGQRWLNAKLVTQA